MPAGAWVSCKHFEVGSRRAGFDEAVLFIGFAGVFSFAGFDHVDLAACWGEGTHFAMYAEKDEFCYVSEVEADSSSVWAAVFASFSPDDVRDVAEAPCLHDLDAVWEEGVGYPEVKVGVVCEYVLYWEGADGVKIHGGVAVKASVFGCYFSGAVLKPPGGVCEYCLKSSCYGG